jgi:hypothetical protein
VTRPATAPGTSLDLPSEGEPLSLPRVRLALAAAVRAGDRRTATELAPLVGAQVVPVARWWLARWLLGQLARVRS